ncbi:MAG: hypothetical protein RBT46_08665 [Weeksellaceae bacterium]|jgi:hypothetical protein|nr:hypothetical protein [Weeksellaceae bacterium]
MKINLLFLFLATFSFGQYKRADFNLVGKVKSLQSVTKSYYNPNETAVSGFLDSEQFDSVYWEFNEKGGIILSENYSDYRGKLGVFDKTIYHYNFSNQIEKVETILIQNGEEPRKITQKKKFYYIKNQLVRIDEFNSGRTTNQFWVANYVYNVQNHLSEKIFWMEDEIFSKNTYEFDSNFNLLSEKNYHNNGSLGKVILYENNKEGQVVKIRTSIGNKETTEIFEYGKFYKNLYETRDENGKIIQTERYDEMGWLTEVQKFNYKIQKVDNYSFIFEFDKNNNWIQCEISKNKHPVYLIQRKITYFK